MTTDLNLPVTLDPPGEPLDASQPAQALEAVLRDENRALAARLREALLASDPAIAPELVTGDTVDEIESSFAAAQALAARVRSSIRQELAASPIPAGAPGRSILGPVSPREKIRAGLSQSSAVGPGAP